MIDIEVLPGVPDPGRAQGRQPPVVLRSSLFHKGTDAICKKVAERPPETIMAAKDKDLLHPGLGGHRPVVPPMVLLPTSACRWTTCSPVPPPRRRVGHRRKNSPH